VWGARRNTQGKRNEGIRLKKPNGGENQKKREKKKSRTPEAYKKKLFQEIENEIKEV